MLKQLVYQFMWKSIIKTRTSINLVILPDSIDYADKFVHACFAFVTSVSSKINK